MDKKERGREYSRNRYWNVLKKNDELYKKLLLTTSINVAAWRKKNPEKIQAQRKVFCAIRNGTLNKKPCEVCLSEKVEAHHEDYSKPLDVIWLCKYHHRQADIERRKIDLSTDKKVAPKKK